MISNNSSTHTSATKCCVEIFPSTFQSVNHFYPKTIGTAMSDLVHDFMVMGNEQIIQRFCHLHPKVDEKELSDLLLHYKPRFFTWSGADLFNTINADSGAKKMILIETNSCPSGHKSMPLLDENDPHGSYRRLVEKTFKPMLEEHEAQLCQLKVPNGKLAVVYDKNRMETSGYAATIADVFGESVFLVEYHSHDREPNVRFVENGQVMQVRYNGDWINIRGCFRYVTQKPWDRLPLSKVRTLIMNPVVCCVAGGRNKLLASKAYEMFNSKFGSISLNTPVTISHVAKKDVPEWVAKFGGYAVVKQPYSNAGQGIWCVTSQQELDEFMNDEDVDQYDQYIVQSLIGHSKWSSHHSPGGTMLYHVGTVPNSKSCIYVADLRMMIHYDYEKGQFAPLALYARKARSPLSEHIDGKQSWDVLGTNLSVKLSAGKWDTEQDRLIICDRKHFSKLGLGVDNLIEAYIQSVLATVAIDTYASDLMENNCSFNRSLFFKLNMDQVLLNELSQLGKGGDDSRCDM